MKSLTSSNKHASSRQRRIAKAIERKVMRQGGEISGRDKSLLVRAKTEIIVEERLREDGMENPEYRKEQS